jgi:hypothetical protein
MVARGGWATLAEQIDDNLTAYLVKYTSIGLDEIDRSRISRLKRLADAVSKIHQAEAGED